MTLLQSIFLGIVQGLTEFFPISSSAHLQLAKHLLGVEPGEHLLYFDLFCHGGTLLALVLFLKKEVLEALLDLRTLFLITLALLPLVPAYFFLKPLRIAASNPGYLGYFLILTSLLLFLSRFRGAPPSSEPKKVKDVLWIGMMQTMALLPGISRSGATVATARLLGWDWTRAARFSFLLAIPAIFGGLFLESFKLFRENSSHVPPISMSCYAAGFLASFLVGRSSVRLVFRIYEKGSVLPFAWYCLGIGFFALWALDG